MERNKDRQTIMKSINFVKYIKFYFAFSGIVIGLGLLSLIAWKLEPSIDFIGGSLAQVSVDLKEGEIISEDAIHNRLAREGIDTHSLQQAGDKDWIVRTKAHSGDV